MEFGEWLCGHVLRAVPHRHWVFSIPKVLRRFFLHDRKLLVELSRCAWECLKTFLQAAVPQPKAVPAAVVSTQTFGGYPDRFHPHLHVLATDGCFYGQGLFRVAPKFQLKDLEKLFRVKVLAMLLRKRKITREFIRRLDTWRHSGFNVFAGGRIQPREKKSLENLAAYLIRATFSQKRMDYCPEVIRRILEHLGLWLANARTTPRAHSPPGLRPLHEDSYSQLPATHEEHYSQAPPAQWDC